MKVGVAVLNFGEPERPDEGEVTAFLERIFLSNARLEEDAGDAARERARQLAARRAPGLLADSRRIGGSPINARTRAQADALAAELESRGRDAVVSVGMQFTPPSIQDAVAALRDAGADRLIGVPLYPLCGPSTTVDALTGMRRSARALDPDWPVTGIAGWHTAPGYTALRADGVRDFCRDAGIDLGDPGTALVFSAHGTPLSYLEAGSRYDVYVEDHCRRLGGALGRGYVVGYQNHANRPGVEWTQPDIDAVIAGLDAERAVVVPVSFMQEQSETLNELDHELRAAAAEHGVGFHRVPVPDDDARFADVLARVVEGALDAAAAAPSDGPAGSAAGEAGPGFRPCQCAGDGMVCLNRELARGG